MKLLKAITVTCLCFCLAVGLRAGLRRFAPSLSAYVWGDSGSLDKSARGLVQAETSPEKPRDSVALVEQSEHQGKAVPLSTDSAGSIYATGAVRYRGRVLVQMSDGSVTTDLDNDKRPVLTRVTANYCDLNGVRMYFRPRTEGGQNNAALSPPAPQGGTLAKESKAEPAKSAGPLALLGF